MKKIMMIMVCNTCRNIIHEQHQCMLAAETYHSKGATGSSWCYVQYNTANISLGVQSKLQYVVKNMTITFYTVGNQWTFQTCFLELDLFLPKLGPLKRGTLKHHTSWNL